MGHSLAAFLLARIQEDEAQAAEHATGWWPNLWRAQAECEAKRRIVERAEAAAVCTQHGRVRDSGCGECIAAEAVEVADGYVLADLAAAYADHPDYSEEWKP